MNYKVALKNQTSIQYVSHMPQIYRRLEKAKHANLHSQYVVKLLIPERPEWLHGNGIYSTFISHWTSAFLKMPLVLIL